MIKKYFIALIFLFNFTEIVSSNENDIYKKIDLFGEVLEKINKEYVDEINPSDSMDSAIDGLLQSLDPYSSYMSPEVFNEMQTETSGEFGGLGIEVTMESGVVAIILILLLFLILIYMVFKKVSFETNDKVKLILIGSISLILMQATIHIGVNIRLFPTTGMTLPFLSYGGSSIVSTSILAGIILNLTKRKIN